MKESGKREPPKGFAASRAGLEYALVQDATGNSAKEIVEMGRWNRMLTALLRGRFYREKKKQSEKAQNKGR